MRSPLKRTPYFFIALSPELLQDGNCNAGMSAFLEKINASKPTLVDFHAVWCGPCKMMDPVLKNVHQKLGEKVTFLKVDVDKNPAAANSLGIRGVPTLILFKNGKILWRQSGMISGADLEAVLQKHLA